MERYSYKGPVCEFGKVVDQNWEGSTMAVSEKKARSNLTYQWKKSHNRVANTVITLPGKIFMED